MNEVRLIRLKKFKESYILIICFIFAVNLVISKISALLASISATILVAVLIMAPILLLNFLIKIEESKIKTTSAGNETKVHKKENEIYCQECRAVLDKETKYCSECGTKNNND